jgi:hypothetical protein
MKPTERLNVQGGLTPLLRPSYDPILSNLPTLYGRYRARVQAILRSAV